MAGFTYEDPIVALATPPGRSAIALIRASGDGCIDLLAQLIDRRDAVLKAPGHTATVGHFLDGPGGEPVDQVSIVVYRSPRSYTGQDSFEIGCHGNPGVVQHMLGVLLGAGFRPAERGEFTLRAFLSGKMDLTQAEAVQELVAADTETGRRLALQRLGGSVRRRIDAIKDALANLMAQVNVQLDYGEDEVEELPLEASALTRILDDIRGLLAGYRAGRLYQAGATVVLAGPPNVGKSSLFNALLQEERAITDPLPGTTRDYLEVALNIRGIPVRLFDTAGLRIIDEGVESRGIEHSNRLIRDADLVVRLVDARDAIEPADGTRSAGSDQVERELRVLAKADLLSKEERKRVRRGLLRGKPAADGEPTRVPGLEAEPLFISAVSHEGIPELEAALAEMLLGSDITNDAVIDSPRQKSLLEEAAEALEAASRALEEKVTIDLVAEDIQAALAALGRITGEVSSDDLLERMFSNFCLGK
jgi:tRNA modification GTPase